MLCSTMISCNPVDVKLKPMIGIHSRCLVGWILVVLAVSLTADDASESPDSGHPGEKFASKDPADATACQNRLRQIYQAIQSYQEKYQRLPNWLSDLVVNGQLDGPLLTCPYVERSGDPHTWRSEVNSGVFKDRDTIWTPTYAYEFCNQSIQLWPGAEVTQADYKYAQRALPGIGDQVPIVRCLAHDPVINLALNGNIYESGLSWEDRFPEIPHRRHHPENIFASTHPLRVDEERIPVRDPTADLRAVNLDGFYNAYLDEAWLPYQDGADLLSLLPGEQTFPTIAIPFDVRALIQLKGKEVLGPFPESVTNIPVNRHVRRVYFLHGGARALVVREAIARPEIADFVFHFEDGTSQRRVIRWGEDVDQWIYDSRQVDQRLPQPAWQGENAASRSSNREVRLFCLKWENPQPDVLLAKISLESRMNRPGSFVVAISAE